ncbi:MAG: amino acid ABC transporter ATP-binding protein [Puniceicoccales bacterium]|jgi:ABC-type polar amino acid transport system ATPase subunit|nr:amino acid ABC transporter ATP-binding protein [Puniceicoccales bacterium]
MLEVNKLNCKIDENTILSDVSFKILSGEICAIIGGSGAGKTTILRILCGLEQRFTGSVLVDNKKIEKGTNYFGLVPQGYSLFNHFTAMDNVAYALRKVKKYSRQQACDIATESLTKFGLKDKLDCYPSKLSGGQKQRVAIARTIVMEPKILLFDEPTSALDPEVTRDVIETIRTLSTTGIPILVVTHDIPMARRVATHVIFLDNGIIIEDCSGKEFFANPRSDRVKCFLNENI